MHAFLLLMTVIIVIDYYWWLLIITYDWLLSIIRVDKWYSILLKQPTSKIKASSTRHEMVPPSSLVKWVKLVPRTPTSLGLMVDISNIIELLNWIINQLITGRGTILQVIYIYLWCSINQFFLGWIDQHGSWMRRSSWWCTRRPLWEWRSTSRSLSRRGGRWFSRKDGMRVICIHTYIYIYT